jgi:sugar phosphate isomerase/epimerase
VERFSVSQITTPNRSFEGDVAALVEVGAPGIGISIRKLEAVGVGAAGRLLREARLAVSCLTSSGFFPLGDEAGEEAALAQTLRHLDDAAALEADCLMILPGVAPALSWEEAAARARPLLERVARAAERACVRVAVEATSQLRMDLTFVHSFADSLDLVDEVGSPWLGVVLELNNAWIERGLYRNIRERTDRIALVQVSDFKVGTLRASERVVIGDGDIPLRRIVEALAAAGYDRWYDIELLGPAIEAEGYDAVVPRAVERFRALWTPVPGAHDGGQP